MLTNIIAILLLGITLAEAPFSPFVQRFTGLCIIFGKNSSVWYTGYLQMLSGSCVLGTPMPFPFGPDDTAFQDNIWTILRFIFAIAVFAAGVINVPLGYLTGSKMRIWRKQIPPPSQDPSTVEIVKQEWKKLKATMHGIYVNVPLGSFFKQVSQIDFYMGKL